MTAQQQKRQDPKSQNIVGIQTQNNSIMGWFKSLGHDISHAAKTVEHGVEKAGSTIAHGVESVGKEVAKGAAAAAHAASNEAENVGNALEKFGSDTVASVESGANWAGKELQEGAAYAQEGLVAAGKFVSANSCSIAIGSALSTAVAAMSTDGEEEASMAALAIAVKLGETAAINTAATAVTTAIVDAVWEIPGVSGSDMDKNTAKQVLKYTIMMAVKQSKSEVILSGGQFLVGAFITVLTGYICSGEVPGGFKVWKGLQ